ncbi:hypothetical protein ACA910_019795 [Epithemia clementina (nom. ined.)]
MIQNSTPSNKDGYYYDKNENGNKNRHLFFRKHFSSIKSRGENGNDADEGKKDLSPSWLLEQVVQGDLQLIDVTPNGKVVQRLANQYNNNHKANNNHQDHVDYTGLFRASFCRLDWSSHEQDPSLTPMFRDVVTFSKCKDYDTLDLYQVVQAARAYHPTRPQPKQQQQQQQRLLQHDSMNENVHDNDPNSFPVVQVLPMQGVVFHESRCGSTLVANLLQWHNPQENVVYSESPPPVAVLNTLGPYLEDHNSNDNDNYNHWTAQVLRDVMFLMSRTTNPHKRRVFFKIQSMGSWNLHLFRAAFGGTHHQNVPWIYVYRDPVEVLMSHLKGGRQANCVRSQRWPNTPPQIQRVLDTYTPRSSSNTPPQSLSLPDYCAAHLASLTETAAHELSTARNNNHHHQDPKGNGGIAVNYRSLPHALVDWIWPQVWNLTLDAEALQRIQAGSQSYSKGRGMRGQFVGDSQAKQEQASSDVKRAAETYLQPSYQALEHLAATAAEQYNTHRQDVE